MTDTENSYARELEIASRLAREAGAVALRCRDGDLGVERKAGNEPVTVADRAASELIVAGLREALPGDGIVSEEEKNLPAVNTDRVWFVDPIDGTKDFIRGEGGFSIMIGLTIAGRPIVGAVYQPIGDRLYCGSPGRGSTVQIGQGPPQQMTCSRVADPGRARLVASKSHREAIIDRVKGTLGIDNEFNIGSVGLKLSLIAVGERDLYVNPSPKCKAWDTCAPEAILHHAGGKITDVHGDALGYDAETREVHKRGLVATNGVMHDDVIAKLAPLFPRRSESASIVGSNERHSSLPTGQRHL